MVDNEHSPDNCKYSEISVGAIVKYPKLLRFVPEKDVQTWS